MKHTVELRAYHLGILESVLRRDIKETEQFHDQHRDMDHSESLELLAEKRAILANLEAS